MTLFLDRDGVLNTRPQGDYVKSWKEWTWLPGALEAMPILSRHFEPIVLVTNQQGVGKGLMTEADLEAIHAKMEQDIQLAGGRLDHILACTQLAGVQPSCRKPSPYLALEAQSKDNRINFLMAYMVGDTASDIQFGKRLGMMTVLIGMDQAALAEQPDLIYPSLWAFASALE